MNKETTRHLAKAADYIAKGDEFYAKAADELIAARVGMKNGPTWTDAARMVGKSDRWVRDVVTSRTKFDAGNEQGDFKVEWARGSHATTAEIEAGAEKLLTTMPPEKAVEVVKTITARKDVGTYLRANPKAAEVVHQASDQIIDDARKKATPTPDEQAEIEEHFPDEQPRTMYDDMIAKNEILSHLLKAATLAIEHDLTDFYLEYLEDTANSVKMAKAEKNPQKAVEDLEQWLADQSDAA